MERECHQSPVIAAPPDDIAEYSGDDEYCIINTPGLGVSVRNIASFISTLEVLT